MERLNKFLRLAPPERRLLLWAVFWLLVMQLALSLLSLRVVLLLPERFGRRRRTKLRGSTEQIVWAIQAADRHLPGRRTCLALALAAQILLLRQGHDARLRIGVGRDEAGGFRAHAWVENEEGILLGGSAESVGRVYRAFPVLQEERS